MITFITGASGHIGGNLVRALLSEGREVRALVREDTRAIDGLGYSPRPIRTTIADTVEWFRRANML